MKNDRFKGLGVAMVTPFTEDGQIDRTALQKLTRFLISGGVDYLVVQGTTGESPTLSNLEKQATLDIVAEENNGELPIVFGIGGNNTQAIIQSFEEFDLSKVDAILSASPYYNKPTQEGIFQHYSKLALHAPKPIILYNVPGRTASNVSAETTLRLARNHDNIIAVKEASGDMKQIMNIIHNKPADFLVISGDDAITLPILSVGGDGVISVVGNAFPKPFKKMVSKGLEQNIEESKEAHYAVYPIIHHLFAEGNPGGIKVCLKEKGIMEETLRLPLVQVSSDRKTILKELTHQIDNHLQ